MKATVTYKDGSRTIRMEANQPPSVFAQSDGIKIMASHENESEQGFYSDSGHAYGWVFVQLTEAEAVAVAHDILKAVELNRLAREAE